MSPVARRLRILVGVVLGLHALVLVRVCSMQTIQHAHWSVKADSQTFQNRRLVPRRGSILDRAGRVLASEEPGFHIRVQPNRLDARVHRCTRCLRTVTLRSRTRIRQCRGCGASPDAFTELTVPRPDRYDRLGALLDLAPGTVAARVEEVVEDWREKRKPEGREPLPVFRNVPVEVAREMHLHPERTPALSIVEARHRLVHHPTVMPHVIGRAGLAWAEDVDRLELLGFRRRDTWRAIVGHSQLERALDDRLLGRMGEQLVVVDHASVVLEVLEDEEPQAGEDIRLTIDLDLQRAAEAALDTVEQAGAFVALDPRNGEILALATSPRYDLETLGRDFPVLKMDGRKPLINRALQLAPLPGSVFKVVTALGVLEDPSFDWRKEVDCGGAFRRGRTEIKCHLRGGHGRVNLLSALERSCNVYFIEAGRHLGRERLEEISRRIGLGERTGVELPEASGILLTAAIARYPSELWYASFGQGKVATTPIQMARVAALIGNGGRLVRPTLLRGEDDPPRPIGLSARALDLVRDGMWRVVNGTRGTARKEGLATFHVAAKTGTAERGERRGVLERNNAWLMGYAPHEAPEVAFACYVENTDGHGGDVCGPIVKRWLEAWTAWLEGGR